MLDTPSPVSPALVWPGPHLTFKGGTSRSKGWKLIEARAKFDLHDWTDVRMPIMCPPGVVCGRYTAGASPTSPCWEFDLRH